MSKWERKVHLDDREEMVRIPASAPGSSEPRGIRVPMRERPNFIGGDEIVAHIPKVGHRISLDIAEDVYPRMGREAIGYAIERLSNEVVYREAPAIRRAVESFLHDRAWAEPIIRQAIQEAVHEIIHDMLETSEANDAR